jgi:site-specific recombinase XerD
MEKLNPLFTLLKDYLTRYLPLERKYSSHTLRSYQKSLELLLDYVKEQNNIPLAKITFEMIDRNILSAFPLISSTCQKRKK